MRVSVILLIFAILATAFAFESSVQLEEQDHAELMAEIQVAQRDSIVQMFAAEAEMHAHLAQQADDRGDQTVVTTETKSWIHQKLCNGKDEPDAPPAGSVEEYHEAVKDEAWDCVQSLAEAFAEDDVWTKVLTASIGCATNVGTAEILNKIKTRIVNPATSAKLAAKLQKILDFFDEHPLVQYAFKEAVSIAADLATSGGDFVGVAVDHAKQWAIDGGSALATDYWVPFKNKLAGIGKSFTSSNAVKALTAARGEIYTMLMQRMPPFIKAAVSALQDARVCDASLRLIKVEMLDAPSPPIKAVVDAQTKKPSCTPHWEPQTDGTCSSPGMLFAAAKEEFRSKSVSAVIQLATSAVSLATTIAAAPTGVGAGMAVIATALSARKCYLTSKQAVHAYCAMDKAWDAFLDWDTKVYNGRYINKEKTCAALWINARKVAWEGIKQGLANLAAASKAAIVAATEKTVGAMKNAGVATKKFFKDGVSWVKTIG